MFARYLGRIIILIWLILPTPVEAYLFVENATALSKDANPIVRSISQGEIHRFSIALEQGQQIRLKLEKRDLRMTVAVEDPSQNQLIKFHYRDYGEEVPWFIAAKKGNFLITVASQEADNVARTFGLGVVSVERASEQDHVHFEAETLFQEGELLRFGYSEKSIRAALEIYYLALDKLEGVREIANSGRILERISRIHLAFGEYGSSLAILRKAVTAATRSGDQKTALEAAVRLAEIHLLTGNTKEGKKRISDIEFRLKRSLVSGNERTRLRGALENRYGELSALKGKLVEARSSFEKALKIWEKSHYRRGEATSYQNLGYIDLDSGDAISAEANFAKAWNLWKELAERRGQAQILTVRGHVETFFDQFEKARESHEAARREFEVIGDRQGQAVALNGLGNVYELLGLPEDAVSAYSDALDINVELKNDYFIAATRLALARAFRAQQDDKRARSQYEKSLEIAEDKNLCRIAFYVKADLAEMNFDAGNYDLALNGYRNTLRHFRDAKDRWGEAILLNRIGEVLLNKKDLALAEHTFKKALQINSRGEYRRGVSDSYYYLSVLEFKRGNLKKALSMIEKSIKERDSSQIVIASPALRTGHRASFQEKLQLQIEILMRRAKEGRERSFLIDAFEKVENTRSRSLKEMLGESRINPGLDPGSELKKRERQLSANIAKAVERQLASPDAEEPRRALDRLRNEYDQLQSTLRSKKNGNLLELPSTNISLSDIQSSLAKDTLYLSYFLGGETSYLWAVSNSEIESYTLKSRGELTQLARNFFENLTARQKKSETESQEIHRKRVERSIREFCGLGEKLRALLLDQVAGRIAGKRLVISLDGALQSVPFEALPTPDSDPYKSCSVSDSEITYTPLLISNEVTYVPSFAVLETLRKRSASRVSTASSGLAIWADPIYEKDDPRVKDKPRGEITPGAQRASELQDLKLERLSETATEAKNIERIWPGRLRKIQSEDANRDSLFDARAAEYRFWHIAAHGFFNTLRPRHSGLVLSRYRSSGEPMTGVVPIQDIFRLRLEADLVVLSACESGLGKSYAGEGLTGLKHAILSAGAQSVMVSLWRIEEAPASALISDYYRRLVEDGVESSDALREAKLHIFRQKGWENPYFWAAFTLHGEYRVRGPNSESFGKSPTFLAISGLALFVSILIYLFRRSKG